jgi:hypothetical protein
MPLERVPDPIGIGVTDSGSNIQMCPHCGARNTRRMGDCSVCHRSVCEECGNVQISHGERHVMHKTCLRKNEGGFKMIKFV